MTNPRLTRASIAVATAFGAVVTASDPAASIAESRSPTPSRTLKEKWRAGNGTFASECNPTDIVNIIAGPAKSFGGGLAIDPRAPRR